MKIGVVIPAYNEEECISDTIKTIREAGNYVIVVVDDGSADETASIAKASGVTVLKFKNNQGVGTAFRCGVAYAHKRGYTHVVQVDADGQHDPRDIARLVKMMKATAADVVIGSRYIQRTSYKTPLFRWVGIKALSLAIRLRTGKTINDPTSGFRLYNRVGMADLLIHACGRCTEAYMTALHVLHGRKISEVSVKMHQRQGGQSKLTLWRGADCLLVNFWRVITLTP